MASAKSEARKYLGKEDDYINLSGLNQERDLANKVYNTNITSLENAYNDLLATDASNRQKARRDFSSGRGTVSENAYLQNKDPMSNFTIRGIDDSIRQLNRLGNSMETSRQYSNLANTFYNTMNELDATARTNENEYNTNREIAQNTLSAALADIGAREANARNAYRAQVAQLAEQIQARRLAAQQLANQTKSMKKAEEQEFQAKLAEIAGSNPTISSYKNAIEWYKQQRGGTDADAINYLRSAANVTPVNESILNKLLKTTNKALGTNLSNSLNDLYLNALQNPYISTNNSGKSIIDRYVEMQPWNRKK